MSLTGFLFAAATAAKAHGCRSIYSHLLYDTSQEKHLSKQISVDLRSHIFVFLQYPIVSNNVQTCCFIQASRRLL